MDSRGDINQPFIEPEINPFAVDSGDDRPTVAQFGRHSTDVRAITGPPLSASIESESADCQAFDCATSVINDD